MNPHNPKNITKCPHCGGTGGYEYSYIARHTQWTEFDGTGVNNNCDVAYKESRKRCIDCHKIIKELE